MIDFKLDPKSGVGYDNPNGICTSSHESNCTGCTISGKLKCRFSASEWLKFLFLFSAFLVPGLIGMNRGGYSNQIGWMFVFWIFFLVYGRLRFYAVIVPSMPKRALAWNA